MLPCSFFPQMKGHDLLVPVPYINTYTYSNIQNIDPKKSMLSQLGVLQVRRKIAGRKDLLHLESASAGK